MFDSLVQQRAKRTNIDLTILLLSQFLIFLIGNFVSHSFSDVEVSKQYVCRLQLQLISFSHSLSFPSPLSKYYTYLRQSLERGKNEKSKHQYEFQIKRSFQFRGAKCSQQILENVLEYIRIAIIANTFRHEDNFFSDQDLQCNTMYIDIVGDG